MSQVLVELSQKAGERITLAEIAAALSDRSFAPLMILFAAPNLLPLPPGSSTIFGIPLILIAAQLLIGRSRVWLPRFLYVRSIDKKTFTAIINKIEPFLKRFERLARPRYWPMPRIVAERVVGLIVLLLAIVLVFPIPFGNLPPAVAIILVSLGLTERDGLWLGCGVLVACASFGIVAGVLGSVGLAVAEVLK